MENFEKTIDERKGYDKEIKEQAKMQNQDRPLKDKLLGRNKISPIDIAREDASNENEQRGHEVERDFIKNLVAYAKKNGKFTRIEKDETSYEGGIMKSINKGERYDVKLKLSEDMELRYEVKEDFGSAFRGLRLILPLSINDTPFSLEDLTYLQIKKIDVILTGDKDRMQLKEVEENKKKAILTQLNNLT